mgnify:FL=1
MGGAIDPKKVKREDSEGATLPPPIQQILKVAAMTDVRAPPLVEYLHGVVDFIPRNIVHGDPFAWKYGARSETELHSALMDKTTGKGLRHDESQVAHSIFQSLQQYPELVSLYHRA